MDLYRDFAYCMVTGFIEPETTLVDVDDTSRLPSNAELATGAFWMTFESTYALDQFEIVQLVTKSADTGPGQLTLQRAAQGSTAYSRNPGTILKHAVTAEMLRTLVAAVQTSSGYKRYVDLGNPAATGRAQVFSNPTVLRGVAAGQAGGSTVVAGALIMRGIEGNAAGAAATAADLTVESTAPTTESVSAAEVFGTQMFGA